MRRASLILLLTFVAVGLAAGQGVQVSRTNKTIAVTADETATVEPDVARLTISYFNYATTNQEAYTENLRASAAILNALKMAGVSEKSIQTESLRLQPVDPEETWTQAQKARRQFQARQTWRVFTSASDAQQILDSAIRAGANEIGPVEWSVADLVGLQAKAGGAALAKARSIAEQMARGLGAKLGELVYANNRAPVPASWKGLPVILETSSTATIKRKGPSEQPFLKLFPEEVKQEATVHAVFALE